MDEYKYKILIGLAVILILVLFVAATYGFFTADVNSDAVSNVITTGQMKVKFEEVNYINSDNWIPGDSDFIWFYVTNVGDLPTSYDVYLNEVYNDFSTKSDLVYELKCVDADNNSLVYVETPETTFPSTNSKIATGIAIDVGKTHRCGLQVTFKETGVNQGDNKGKYFSTKVSLVEGTVNLEYGYAYHNPGGWKSSVEELVTQTNKNYMIKEKFIVEYTYTKNVYTLYRYGSQTYDTMEECQRTGYYCEEYNGKIRYKISDYLFGSLEECMADSSYPLFYENGGGCELKEEYDEERKVEIDGYLVSQSICVYVNDNLICLDNDYDWNHPDYYDILDYNSRNYIDPSMVSIVNILRSNGFKCDSGSYEFRCYNDDNLEVYLYEDGIKVREGGYYTTIQTLDVSRKYEGRTCYENGYDCLSLTNNEYRILNTRTTNDECFEYDGYIDENTFDYCTMHSTVGFEDYYNYCEYNYRDNTFTCGNKSDGK